MENKVETTIIGFKVWGLGIWGLGLRAWDLGFRVLGPVVGV